MNQYQNFITCVKGELGDSKNYSSKAISNGGL